jgi:hypothetical protein
VNTDGKSEMKSLFVKKKELEIKMENFDKRYFDNPNFGDEKYNKYVLQFAIELNAIEEQIDMNGKKLSNHKKHIEKVVDKIKNISDC